MEIKQLLGFLIVMGVAVFVPPKLSPAQTDMVPVKPSDPIVDSIAAVREASAAISSDTREKQGEGLEIAKRVSNLAADVPKSKTRIKRVEPQFLVKYQGENTLARTEKYGLYRIFDMDEFLIARSLDTIKQSNAPAELINKPTFNPTKKNLWQKLTSPFRRSR